MLPSQFANPPFRPRGHRRRRIFDILQELPYDTCSKVASEWSVTLPYLTLPYLRNRFWVNGVRARQLGWVSQGSEELRRGGQLVGEMAERSNAENALLSLWTPWPTPRRGCRCAWAAGVVADHDAYRSRGRVAPQRTQPRGHTPWIDHPDLASATCTRHARGTDPPRHTGARVAARATGALLHTQSLEPPGESQWRQRAPQLWRTEQRTQHRFTTQPGKGNTYNKAGWAGGRTRPGRSRSRADV